MFKKKKKKQYLEFPDEHMKHMSAGHRCISLSVTDTDWQQIPITADRGLFLCCLQMPGIKCGAFCRHTRYCTTELWFFPYVQRVSTSDCIHCRSKYLLCLLEIITTKHVCSFLTWTWRLPLMLPPGRTVHCHIFFHAVLWFNGISGLG